MSAVATMPSQFAIGTSKAFRNNYAFKYTRCEIDDEIVYICDKGSAWARENEVLVLRCENGTWTAWDSSVDMATAELRCRQPIFRCDGDITEQGWHNWAMNHAATKDGEGAAVNWTTDPFWCETRHL